MKLIILASMTLIICGCTSIFETGFPDNNLLSPAEQHAAYLWGNPPPYNSNIRNIDNAEAIQSLKRNAIKGDAQAQCKLGICYAKGIGVETNCEEAVKWLIKSADQGNAQAQNSIGICYSFGFVLTKDLAEAARLFLKSADQGYSRAQYNLAVCYTYGAGVDLNYSEAAQWYRKASDQGIVSGVCDEGMITIGKGMLFTAKKPPINLSTNPPAISQKGHPISDVEFIRSLVAIEYIISVMGLSAKEASDVRLYTMSRLNVLHVNSPTAIEWYRDPTRWLSNHAAEYNETVYLAQPLHVIEFPVRKLIRESLVTKLTTYQQSKRDQTKAIAAVTAADDLEIFMVQNQLLYMAQQEDLTQPINSPSFAPLPSFPIGGDNYRYKGTSGTQYKYDLSNPLDKINYSIDPFSQLNDNIYQNIIPGVKLDQNMRQYGGGIKP